jgi:hypothetical protein
LGTNGLDFGQIFIRFLAKSIKGFNGVVYTIVAEKIVASICRDAKPFGNNNTRHITKNYEV